RDNGSLRTWPAIAPQYIAADAVEGDHLVVWRGDEQDSVVHHRRRFVGAPFTGSGAPHRPQPRNIRRSDLIERAVTPAVISPADHRPMPVFGLQQPLGRHRLVILKNRRHGGWRTLFAATLAFAAAILARGGGENKRGDKGGSQDRYIHSFGFKHRPS